jgi:hypothetical protein
VLPEASGITLEIYGLNGTLIEKRSITAQRGYLELMVDAEAIGGPGIYTYRISTNTEYRTLRMIVVGE